MSHNIIGSEADLASDAYALSRKTGEPAIGPWLLSGLSRAPSRLSTVVGRFFWLAVFVMVSAMLIGARA